MGQDLGSLVLRIDRAKGRFRVISTELWLKMTLSKVLEKSKIPFNFRMRVLHERDKEATGRNERANFASSERSSICPAGKSIFLSDFKTSLVNRPKYQQ